MRVKYGTGRKWVLRNSFRTPLLKRAQKVNNAMDRLGNNQSQTVSVAHEKLKETPTMQLAVQCKCSIVAYIASLYPRISNKQTNIKSKNNAVTTSIRRPFDCLSKVIKVTVM